MRDQWMTRSGHWRRSMAVVATRSPGERLYQVIRADVETGRLPPGSPLPALEDVAAELAMERVDVQAAYARLMAEAILEARADGALFARA